MPDRTLPKPSSLIRGWLFLFCLLFLPLAALPAEISLHAKTSTDHAKLGESLVYSLTLNLTGQTQFSPQIKLPDSFPGFQVRQGPQQQQSMSWVNGNQSQSWTFSWELAPVKSGTLQILPVKVVLKDPVGELVRSSETLKIQVARGKSFLIPPTPTAVPSQAPAPAMELRPLKADLGLPWMMLGLVALAVSLPMALLLWLLLRKPKPRVQEPVARHPGQAALLALEQCRPLLKSGEMEVCFKQISAVLRGYLKQQLDLAKPEPTLFEVEEAVSARLRAAKVKDAGRSEEALQDLSLILFARKEPSLKEAEDLLEQARQVVLTFESLPPREEENVRRKKTVVQR